MSHRIPTSPQGHRPVARAQHQREQDERLPHAPTSRPSRVKADNDIRHPQRQKRSRPSAHAEYDTTEDHERQLRQHHRAQCDGEEREREQRRERDRDRAHERSSARHDRQPHSCEVDRDRAPKARARSPSQRTAPRDVAYDEEQQKLRERAHKAREARYKQRIATHQRPKPASRSSAPAKAQRPKRPVPAPKLPDLDAVAQADLEAKALTKSERAELDQIGSDALRIIADDKPRRDEIARGQRYRDDLASRTRPRVAAAAEEEEVAPQFKNLEGADAELEQIAAHVTSVIAKAQPRLNEERRGRDERNRIAQANESAAMSAMLGRIARSHKTNGPRGAVSFWESAAQELSARDKAGATDDMALEHNHKPEPEVNKDARNTHQNETEPKVQSNVDSEHELAQIAAHVTRTIAENAPQRAEHRRAQQVRTERQERENMRKRAEEQRAEKARAERQERIDAIQLPGIASHLQDVLSKYRQSPAGAERRHRRIAHEEAKARMRQEEEAEIKHSQEPEPHAHDVPVETRHSYVPPKHDHDKGALDDDEAIDMTLGTEATGEYQHQYHTDTIHHEVHVHHHHYSEADADEGFHDDEHHNHEQHEHHEHHGKHAPDAPLKRQDSGIGLE